MFKLFAVSDIAENTFFRMMCMVFGIGVFARFAVDVLIYTINTVRILARSTFIIWVAIIIRSTNYFYWTKFVGTFLASLTIVKTFTFFCAFANTIIIYLCSTIIVLYFSLKFIPIIACYTLSIV